MTQLFLKILKIFLIISAIFFAVLLSFGVVLSVGWPWWVGFFILIGALGLWLGLMFFKKIWLRHREQRFVHQIIEQDESYLKTLMGREKEYSKELQAHWKEAIESLRSSHLKKYGNPLYVLPWYLVIGESGSGKTTAIESARLSSPFAEMSRTSGISGTRNCDWWFFEQAVILDTAGRYAIPVDEGRDKEEWQNFLTLLSRYRKREPLNGLVVTIAADKLLDARPETLEEDGRSIRRRIDELMRVLGAKFPVYILVTKCDLIQGMTQFCDQLPEKSLDQAMGFLNHDLKTDVMSLHERGILTLGERLRDLRLLLIHQAESKGVGQKTERSIDPSLFLFPEEFERLKYGLSAFIKGAFKENPYQETPILRGVFYSSGRQEGSPYSHFLNSLGLIEEKEVLPGTNKGLFLFDFFARILPKDRNLFAPTQHRLEWSRLTRNLGLTSWIAVIIAICGLLSFSFVKNLKTLKDVSVSLSKPLILQGETLTDAMIMDRFRQAILKVGERNRKWWIPRLGLNESEAVENRLRVKYCRKFNDGFLASFDKQVAEKMANFSHLTPHEVLGSHIVHLVRRINLLQARLKGESLETLQSLPQPSYDLIALSEDQTLMPEIQNRFGNLYLYYLIWQPSSGGLNQEMNDLQSWLKHILTLEGLRLNWLITWVNQKASLSGLNLKDFWSVDLPESEKITIPPAFTVKGKERIELFIKEIESALFDPLVIANQKLEFQTFYRNEYIQAWYDFGAVFPQGEKGLQSMEQRRQTAAAMAGDQSPYFVLLDRMSAELKPIAVGENLPDWIKLVFDFHAVGMQVSQMGDLKEKGVFSKATEKGKAFITKLEKKTEGSTLGKALESQLIAAQALQAYQNALAQITPATASRRVSFQMAGQAFGEDPVTGQSLFFLSQNAVTKLKTALSGATSNQKMFWKLVNGPFDYLWNFVCNEAACQIQNLWEKEVLVEVQGISSRTNLTQLLLGPDGYATKFTKESAAPFINRSLKKGYYAKTIFGTSLPFHKEFFSFLEKGVKAARPVKSNYSVSIKGLPTDANAGARLKPHATRLQLQCADDIQSMINLNYPIRKGFNWSPQNCGDVVFKIEVGSLVLTQKYTGDQAFPRFLKDFAGGRTFYPDDFPQEAAALKRMGIEYMKVKYEFKGHEPILELLRERPGRVPRTIVTCWDQ
ncbi:MAG: hypothetical protein JW786_11590 [Desulfobacterales bacterium]|nr:hypothetical protein [Desulfobacterales bacterium]